MRVTDFSLVALATSLCVGCPTAFGLDEADQQSRRGYVSSASLPPDESQLTDAYPHINTLEKAILGQTYAGHVLTERLGRMETKAFGKASTDPDLSLRTDALEDYAQKTLHQKPFGAGSAADTDEYENGPGSGSSTGSGSAPSALAPSSGAADAGPDGSQLEPLQTDYPHITALEKSILGQTFPGQPLPDRLVRMETKAFGKASTLDDFSERTDMLEGYAEKKLHMKPFVRQQEKEAVAAGGMPAQGAGQSSGQSSGQSKLLSIVGNSLLTMAGVGRMGMPMMGGVPGFGNGMGGGIMPGFGGVRVRPRQASDQQQSGPPVDVHPEDQSVHDAMPPPAEAKMLTKVGWCEVQIFGHTFPNLHLPARLLQLSKELNYAPGKSALDLMDDVGGLIKAVQARKQAGRSAAGASPTVPATLQPAAQPPAQPTEKPGSASAKATASKATKP